MIKHIKCTECGELLGTIDKPVVTAQDEMEYAEMVACSLGHAQTARLVDETQE